MCSGMWLCVICWIFLWNVRKISPNHTASHPLENWNFNSTAVRTSSVASHNTVLTHLASFSVCLKLCDSCLRFHVTYCTWRTLAASLHHWRTVVYSRLSLTCENRLLASLCQFVRMGQIGFDWADFHEIWYFSIYWKSAEKIQVLLKMWQEYSASTGRIFMKFGISVFIENLPRKFKFY